MIHMTELRNRWRRGGGRHRDFLLVLTAGEQLLTRVGNLRFGRVNADVVLDGLDYNAALETAHCCSVTKSCLTLATPWTAVHQAPLSVGFPRQEYWSGLSFPFPGDLPDPGLEPGSLALQADSLPIEAPGRP